VISATERVVGRARLAKLARLVTNEVRLDVDNEIDSNGETDVQRLALTAPDPIVFDVGAHFGEWSKALLAQGGNVPTLHLFEPSAATFQRALRAVGNRGTVHQLALSDHVGKEELQIVHEFAGANSLVPFTDKKRPSGQVEVVAVSTVDAVAADLGISRVTLLKIDAEGHDLAVIRGASRMLDDRAIGLVQFEYNSRWIDSRTLLLDAFLELQPRGYTIGKVTPRGMEVYPTWHPELETFREANYLAWLPQWTSLLTTFDWWGG
jgi:FkbM family methyltransferase